MQQDRLTDRSIPSVHVLPMFESIAYLTIFLSICGRSTRSTGHVLNKELRESIELLVDLSHILF